MNKTLVIICTAVIVLAIAVPSTILIMNKINADNQSDVTGFGANITNEITADMTFEEYSKDFKDDVTDDQIEEAQDLFNQIQQAIADEDTDSMRSLMMQINQLDLFETSGQMGGGQMPGGGEMPEGGMGEQPSGGQGGAPDGNGPSN